MGLSKVEALVRDGCSLLVGTSDKNKIPEVSRGAGFVLRGTQATLYVPQALAGLTRRNLAERPLVAVGFSRMVDHVSMQVKGPVLAVRDCSAEDEPRIAAYTATLQSALVAVGVRERVTTRIVFWPAFAVEMECAEIFEQTPGPGAGQRL